MRSPDRWYDQLTSAQDPIVVGRRSWAVARHRLGSVVLQDSRFIKPPTPCLPVPAARVMFRSFLLVDPPDHTRIRASLRGCFSPAAVAALELDVGEIAKELIGEAVARQQFDVTEDIARPLPFRVICDVLGVPEESRDELAALSRTLTESMDAQIPASLADAFGALLDRRSRPIAAARAITKAVRIAGDMLDRCRDDSMVVAALDDARRRGDISQAEAAAAWITLFTAGHETSVTMIANAVHALVTRPEQLRMVRERPSLVDAAVEETLRFHTPVVQAFRVAGEAVDIGSVTIGAGDRVAVLLGAANRDREVFADPHRFDVGRSNARNHLAFGLGIHHCLGAQLARIETRAVIRSLLDATISLDPASPGAWVPSLSFRSMRGFCVAAVSRPDGRAPSSRDVGSRRRSSRR